MSVVVALKFKNGVVLGADRQISSDSLAYKDSTDKIWTTNNSRVGFGAVGSLKELQRLNIVSEDIVPNEKLNLKNCIKMTDRIVYEYRKHSYIHSGDILEDLDGSYIITDGYNIFFINHQLAVMKAEKFASIGCGDELTRGYLNNVLENKNIEDLDSKEASKIVKETIKIACKESLYIDDNIDIIVIYKDPRDVVTDKEFEVIENTCEFVVAKKSIGKKCNNKCEECEHNLFLIWDNYRKRIHTIAPHS